MTTYTSDQAVLAQIERLLAEEHRMYERGKLSDTDRVRLKEITVELDQLWDLLRQRRALREFGKDPNEARIRPPEVVEKYKG
ncbi:MAG: hypothetical protein QOK01_743 [Alphaproteobacteria bacterium]|nr:hypothetical protein [Alphaproteobacteria bacterium]